MQINTTQPWQHFLPCLTHIKGETRHQVEREIIVHKGHGAQCRSAVRSWSGGISTQSSAGCSHYRKPHYASTELYGQGSHVPVWGRPRARINTAVKLVISLVTAAQSDAIPAFVELKFLLLLLVCGHLNPFYFMKIHTKMGISGKVSFRICVFYWFRHLTESESLSNKRIWSGK